ncbi:MAG: hypothetical protein LLG00_15745 [Planctomycetaceae bacterium]|nr:hypothetical protein [Planctomycetaceae bacterium]
MSRKCFRATACLLAVVMTYAPSMALAQSGPADEPSQVEGKPKIDLGFVTPKAAAALVLYPRHVLTSPQSEILPTEVITAAGKKYLGIDPLQIEQVIAIAEPPQAGPPSAAVVLRMAEPLGEGKILGPLWERTTEAQLDGKTYRRAAGPTDFSIFRPDDRTLIVANDELLRQIVANRSDPKEGPMSRILGRVAAPPDAMAILLVEPVRPLLAMPLAMVPVPPQFEDVKKIPNLLTSIGAKVNLTEEFTTSLTLKATDETAAEQLEQIFDKLLDAGKEAAMAEMAKKPTGDDPVEQAGQQYAKRMSERMLQALRPVRKGQTLTLATDPNGKNPQTVQVATIGVLVALLLPAVQAAREAARRVQSSNGLPPGTPGPGMPPAEPGTPSK